MGRKIAGDRNEDVLTYPIAKWSNDEIVAKDQTGPLPGLTGCVRTTITIERQQKNALWVEEPINQTDPFCKNADTNVNKFTIEDAPGWKRLGLNNVSR